MDFDILFNDLDSHIQWAVHWKQQCYSTVPGIIVYVTFV